ncbi:MAG TPA: chloride channel protein [Tepidisphaeraceae bacterium]|nr:chloride channel protein [Tepidisphaeraceae bacterium]
MTTPSAQPNLAGVPTNIAYTRRFWVLVFLTGVAAGLATGGLMLLLDFIQHRCWPYHAGDNLLDAIERATPARRVLVLLIAGAWIGVGGWVLRHVYKPGISLEGTIWFKWGEVPMIATIARAVWSLVSVGLGMTLGREAAAKQAAGALASGFADRGGIHPAHHKILVACGVGAGMAAAYNVPFGGAIFAAEVLLGTLSVRLLMPAIVMCAVATGVSWLMLPIAPIYAVPATHLSVATTIWALAVGPLLGAFAAVFIKSVAWAGGVKLKPLPAVLAPIATLGLLGILAISVPQLLGNGQESVQIAFDGGFGLVHSASLPVLKALLVVACLACGARGGLFTPSMMIGATFGGLAAWAWPGLDRGICAMIGATAMLAATTQGPISSLVMVLELTRHGDTIMVPMLLAVAGATLTSEWLDGRSIYSARAVGVDGQRPLPRPMPEVRASQSPAKAKSKVLRTGTYS